MRTWTRQRSQLEPVNGTRFGNSRCAMRLLRAFPPPFRVSYRGFGEGVEFDGCSFRRRFDIVLALSASVITGPIP
jgi:hypothetical protein